MGLLKSGPEFELFKRYQTRLIHKVKLVEFKTLKELERFLGDSEKGTLVLLDEKGKSLSTVEMASFLTQEWPFTFVIGAHDGFSDLIYAHSHIKWSFGRQTLPHLFVRALLMEQLYRVQQIMNNHPYHRS